MAFPNTCTRESCLKLRLLRMLETHFTKMLTARSIFKSPSPLKFCMQNDKSMLELTILNKHSTSLKTEVATSCFWKYDCLRVTRFSRFWVSSRASEIYFPSQMIKEQNRVRGFWQVLYLLWYEADKLTRTSKFCENDRTDAYYLKRMALN
jgi:hypothetical protein